MGSVRERAVMAVSESPIKKKAYTNLNDMAGSDVINALEDVPVELLDEVDLLISENVLERLEDEGVSDEDHGDEREISRLLHDSGAARVERERENVRFENLGHRCRLSLASPLE